MRHYHLVGAMALVLFMMPSARLSAEPARNSDMIRTTRLIEQLGDESFALREAAMTELAAIGEPALEPLRRVAATHRDLEVQWRAGQIARAILARTLPVGSWRVEFANGVTEVCQIDDDGWASVTEPLRSSRGTAAVRGGSAVLTFQDDRTERWTWDGEQLLVEHWFPSSRFPSGAAVSGIARRTP